MVLYDDKKWLSRLIRTAFSIEDDTGICEKVLKEKPYLEGYEPESDSAESDESFDIREASELGSRSRSNTAVRLEKMDKERKAQTEVQVVKLNPDEPIRNCLSFNPDTTYQRRVEEIQSPENIFSMTRLLESVSSPDNLPFSKYARFEASFQPASIPSKTIAIFLTFLPPDKRSYPLAVSVTITAKIIDLIGLILWMTSQKFPEAQLHSLYSYNLQIADDDGEWDTDFPPLDHNEPVQKFSFSHLALVKSTNAQKNDGIQRISLSFLLPNRSIYRIKVDNVDVPIGQLINQLLNESGWNVTHQTLPKSTFGYHLEKLGDSRIKFTDPLLPLSLTKCKEFCLVRDGAKSVQDLAGPSHASASARTAVDLSAGRPDLMFSCMIPVMVAVGRFNKLKNAMCVIWSGDRMDLEFQHKIKHYPLSQINSVKYDALKNRIVLSVIQSPIGGGFVGHHYVAKQLTFLTSEARQASELYQHLNLILTTRK